MATKFARKRIIFAELEATEGTAETIVGADAIRTKNLALDAPYAGDRITRELNRDDLGLESSININPHAVVSFDVEIQGGGAAGTPPPFADLLLASAWAETIDAGVDVVYTPVSEPTDSVTLEFYLDGELHQLVGAKGTWEIHFERGIPYMRFTFMGLYSTPTSDSAPTPDFTAWTETPLPMTNTNTPTCTIGGFAGVLHSLTAIGNLSPVTRDVPNLNQVIQPDRQVSGQIVLDRPDIASKDIYTDAVESHAGVNTLAVVLVHGTEAGNTVRLDAPAVQLEDIQDGEESSIATSTFSARYIPDEGDDEVTLTFT